MKFVVTNEQMRAAEARCGERFVSLSRLMRNAGEAAAERILELLPEKRPAVVLCGAGNNGGDGFVIARRLWERGFEVFVILCGGEVKSDIAKEYFELLPEEIIFGAENAEKILKTPKIAVVDCVFGTGFHGKLPKNIAEIFKTANFAELKFSADVPSGANSDSGEFDENCFKPQFTFVFAAMKAGLLNPKCADIAGKYELLDIGIPESCFENYEAIFKDEGEDVLPPRVPSSHKGSFGRLLNIAGSLCYCGAAAMSTKAALRMGAGLCTLAAPKSVVKCLASSLYETTYLPLSETEEGFVGDDCRESIEKILPKMSAVSIGCGLGNSENVKDLTEFVIKTADCPIIIDADGINSIASNINVLKERTSAKRATVLTPHPLEFSRISGLSVGEIISGRIKAAREFSREFGAVVLLKGAFSVVADGDFVSVNASGCAGLSKGGSGDVLTGIIAALLCQGVSPRKAAAEGAFIHGKTAERLCEKMPMRALLATDVIEGL